jgi:hypothetical protein
LTPPPGDHKRRYLTRMAELAAPIAGRAWLAKPRMPDRITDPPPPEVAAQLANLAAALDQVIPAKQPGSNLLLETWNVRAFDRPGHWPGA